MALPESAPSEMIPIPGGEFYMGRNESERKDEIPRHLVRIPKFFIDETLVTRDAFAKFASDAHYVSTAEKQGYGMVAREGMPNWKWEKMKGANWRNPFGPGAKENVSLYGDDPVVSMNWFDALAYCQAQGKRLPTEAEWEYAARAGKNDSRFPWGDNPEEKPGKMGLNFWQGTSHRNNVDKDGFLYLSPVRAFPPNKWGMYDPVGNVWQWVNDWYDSEYFRKVSSPKGISNPKGPKSGKRKVGRGGSWWCSPTTCSGFGLFYRGESDPGSVFNNNGFRCAKDVPIV